MPLVPITISNSQKNIRFKTKKGCPPFQVTIKIRQEKKIQGIQPRKEKNKTSLFSEIISLENLKKFTKQQLDEISQYISRLQDNQSIYEN